MTLGRAASWLLGMAVALTAAALIRAESSSTWAGRSDLVWWIDVLAATALVTASVMCERLTVPVVTWVAGAIWLLPDLAGVRTLAPAIATALDASAWVLPGLIVLTLASASGLPLRSRPASLVAAGTALGGVDRIVATNPFVEVECWHVCRDNPLAWQPAEPIAHLIAWLAAAFVAIALVLLLVDPRVRRVRQPAALTTVSATCLLLPLVTPSPGPVSPWAVATHLAAGVAAALLGVWLVADEIRQVLLRHRFAALVVDLSHAPAPGHFAEALRIELADPGLLVGYWVPEPGCFVDGEGVPVSTPRPDGHRVISVTRAGSQLAVLGHSRGVDPARVDRALGPAMRLAMENDRLRAAVLFELREVDQSRRRILERAQEERRRLERNLHDSAQQRVVSLILTLRMIAGRAQAADRVAAYEGADLAAQLLDRLRQVARGIHPVVVADSGLAGALADLAENSTDVPVEVHVAAEIGLSALAQSTAYEFVATALADARAADATSLTVHSTGTGKAILVGVDHDAARSPDTVDLDGVAVHAEALAGRVTIEGEPGRWHVAMELPCGS